MITITMPKAGQTMEEGTLLAWRKHEGEPVRKGEILFEIETDKANIEVEAPESGVLRRILCPEGSTVPVLAPVAILADASEEETGAAESAAASELQALLGRSAEAPEAPAGTDLQRPETESQPPSGAPPRGRIKASPLARKMARERRLDLASAWPGSGPGGRILSTDINRVARIAAAPPAEARRPLSAMRKAIARNVSLAKQTIPHFYMRLTVDAGKLQEFCRAEKAKYSCSVTDAITLACAQVMREFAAFRSRLEGEELIETAESNIGIAVGMDDGLRVPVLLAAERMSLKKVAKETRRIVEAARGGKVEAMGRGSLTISNLGMYGVEEFSAIINPPEAAILAVGAIREAVLAEHGALRPGRVLTMTLSADHRIIDGLLAARFLNRLKEILESPELLTT